MTINFASLNLLFIKQNLCQVKLYLSFKFYSDFKRMMIGEEDAFIIQFYHQLFDDC